MTEPTIHDLLVLWNNIKVKKQKVDKEEDIVRNKIKAYLKERRWKRYTDKDTKISVALTEAKRESVDKIQLQLLLNKSDYDSIIKTTKFEKMTILTEDARKKIQKMVR